VNLTKDCLFIDWRINWAAKLAQDLPPAFPGGPSSKTGDPIYQVTLTRSAEGELIGFTCPSPSALALHIAIKAAKEASKLKKTIAFQRSPTPHGEGKSVAIENTSPLFDYFESCMIAVTFSMQSLEVFCNTVIADHLKGTVPIKENKKEKRLNAKQVQVRTNIPVTQKLDEILPQILAVASPKKSSDLWEELLELIRTRKATIHMKSKDAFNGAKIDEETLFYEFFRKDPSIFPRCVLEIMQYFSKSIGDPKWIESASNLLELEG